MAQRLSTNAQIDKFISRVIGEANHHAVPVNAVIFPLSKAVRARLDLKSDKVEIYSRAGNLARTCWITLAGKRYVFSYNYNAHKIDLRKRSLRGRVIHQFDNQTNATTIRRIVGSL